MTTTRLGGVLVLNPDVLLVPVEALPDETRAQIACDPGDFALSRPQARTGSKVVDADAAALLRQFSAPRSVAEAVILFARSRALDPGEVLEGAHAFLRGLVDAGFLVSGSDGAAPPVDPHGPSYPPGTTVAGAEVVRTLAVLDDTEIVLVRRDGESRVLKLARRGGHGVDMEARLRHEAAYLRALGGVGAPRLVGELRVDGRAAIEMDFVAGVDLATAAAEWRDDAGARPQLLALLGRVAQSYAGLHARGILHGDVHPRNVLVTGDGAVHLVDFGVAAPLSPGALPSPPARGGIPFFFEPEFAAATQAGRRHPATAAGEQFAVAAMLWFAATGAHSQAFRLAHDEMLDDIAHGTPRTFAASGAAAWPALEAVLTRALARDPAARFTSMAAFATAIDAAETTNAVHAPAVVTSDVVDTALARTWPGGAWWETALQPPTASLMYGGAGIALGLRQIAERRDDAATLAAATLWAHRAARSSGDEAFYHAPIQISPDVVGRVSPFHTRSGLHAVSGLVAASQGDAAAFDLALAGYVDSTATPTTALDLTMGLGSVALGAAFLVEAATMLPDPDTTPVRRRGDAAIETLWAALDALPPIAAAGIDYTGAAHGWGGFAYAALAWTAVTGAPLPASLPRRLDELADLARPTGRGLEWPWMLRHGTSSTMPGWCNGSAGLVPLWHLAHRLTGDPSHAERASAAAWHVWDAAEPGGSLCCGLAGRAYALLTQYRHTGDAAWLRRARTLADRARRDERTRDEYPHSLYKGAFSLAVLFADLEHPEDACFPFYELRPDTLRELP